ncbi:hypothetical protein EAX61_12155 [Dokdonia sinensis]|uniref:Uncharacterized protein n=1 Tax=Dokdonia sinensis TaxID=2479847 RepID=A0A3M0FZ02_9FLAO|nr:hypothetical protein [Dokdonia sinensis]RMB57117.1 hypothetical protein EAX61_12155 [Dokdonia sinensis]
MKQFLRQITAFLLAFLVVGSTSSFSIAKHYCGGHLMDVAYFGDAQPCAMEMALANRYGCDQEVKSDCCKDEKIIIEGQDELKIQFESFSLDQIVFVSAFTYSYVDLFQGLEQYFVPFDGYPPPLITHDFQSLFEQYLI